MILRSVLAGCLLVALAGQVSAAGADLHDANSSAAMAARAQPCTACHGPRGYATNQGYYPRIAGKPPGYLFDQMRNFRAGRRHFPEMVYLMQLQDDAYLRQLADYFASQELPYPPPEAPAVGAGLRERGRQLALQGVPSQGVPACSACHGARLLGVQPAVPGLLGVSQDYLLAQLGAWRSGARAAYPPDCMAQIARRLSTEDATAVTAWLASQPVPNGGDPDGSAEVPPPMRCGSFQQAVSAPAAQGAAAALPVPAPAESLAARGRALVIMGDCEACHTERGDAPFAGGRAIPTPFGIFYSPNITPDASTGIGQWREQDFWRALHEGIGRDGRYLYPTFPYTNYTKLTRDDVDAMFAYLRTLRPVRQRDRSHQLHFPFNHRSLLAGWRLLFFAPGVYRTDPTRSGQWNRGAYLVQGLGHCSACHEARNSLGAVRSRSDPAGGLVLSWYAPSLSRLDQAGLQDWSVPDIVTLLGTGASERPNREATTLGPMAEVVYSSLQFVAGRDLQAMATYLRSLPQTSVQENSASRASDQTLYDGQQLYARNCASCHGAQGQGRQPQGPALSDNRAVTMASPVDPIRVVLFGGYPPGTAGNPRPYGMPPFAQALNDDQIATVLSYVRGAWANQTGPVNATDVAANRATPLW